MISERDVIYITKKQASIAVAALTIFCLLIFMVGYFWGKQSVLEGFGQRLAQESEADQANYLTTMQSFAQKVKQDIEPVQIERKVTSVDTPSKTQSNVESVKSKPIIQKVQKVSVSKSHNKHRATLLGFGTRSAALNFVNRLKKHNITVEIKQRTSKSASGKVKHWYQIVTKSYDSKDQLQELVDRIKKFERIKDSDIKII